MQRFLQLLPFTRRRVNAVMVLALFVGSASALRAQTNIVYPADAGVINVKNAPYNAKGDGITDDTQAIQAALSAGLGGHAVVYLPNGTYLVSSTLRWKNSSTNNGGWDGFLSIQGQSQSGTIIKLQNNLPAFANPAAPAAVLMTGSRDGQGAYSDLNGEGNQAFENSILNLTVDVGAGNPGAIGVDYQVSNWGAMRNVTVRTSDPGKAGLCGVNLLRRDNGPGIIEKVTIEGFQYGIRAGQEIAQFTLENITLSGQSVVGIEDTDAILAIRKLTSTNTVPALRVGGNALVNLLEANLSGGTAASAIDFTGSVSRGYLRGITTSGYASALRRNGAVVAGSSVTEWVSDPVLGANSGGKLSLNLPIEETPEYFDGNLANWAYVGPASGDMTVAIQAAMNSGKSTVYFGRGFYSYSNTITVPATVRHIIGTGSVLRSTVDLAGKPMFRFEGGTEPVVLERFELNARNGYLVEHASPRTVVMQDIGSFDEGFAYRNQAGAGKLFVNDVSAKGWFINSPQLVWARQFNPEGNATYVTNTGGTMWVLGFKVENSETLFDTRSGGSTEALGGFTYTFGDRGKPALINNGSKVSASFGGTSYVANGAYGTLVRETSGTTTTTIAGSSAYGGRTYSVPMYVGILDASAPPPGGGNGTGTGLTGQYFDNQDLTNLRLTRVDPTVNFDWGTGSPGRKIGADSFSARWTGQVQPRYSETYTFSITSDNGRRLWVNDQLIIDQWIDNQGVTYSGTIALLAGQKYNIRVEYFESFGGASIRLEWNSPTQVREVVPQTQLYPTAAARIAAETGVETPELQLRAFPNPTAGETVISFTPTRDEAVRLHLYDPQGRLVQRIFEGRAEAGVTRQHTVHGQALKNGLYLIRLNTGTGTVNRKLLIAK